MKSVAVNSAWALSSRVVDGVALELLSFGVGCTLIERRSSIIDWLEPMLTCKLTMEKMLT